MKKKKSSKLLAVLLALGLVTGALSACGKEPSEDGKTPGSEDGSVAAQTQGRYVEKEVALPSELADWSLIQMSAEGDALYLLASRQQDEKTILREWCYQDGSFTDVTPDWLASMELPAADWVDLKLIRGAGDTQYLYAGYTEDDDSFRGHLWKGTEGEASEITPEKWTIPDEDWGGYEMIQGLAALDNGTLVSLSYTYLDILSAEDGSVLESEPASTVYEGNLVTDGENVYLCSSDASGSQIEKRRDGRGADSLILPFPAAGGSESNVFTFGGSGSLFLDVLKDGTLIAGGENGLFRLPGTAAEEEWEQLMPGIETDFSMPDCWCLNLAALENGGIYALFETEEGQKLNFYEYDTNAVSEVTQVLKLYTVYESALLKQAAAMYHKEHPDTVITIEYEYPMYFFDTPDYDAVYQKLNTMLLGDNAPDLMVMDHLNMDSYASRGLLADLNNVVKPLEENGELLSNITGSYVREDGSRYIVPLQFSFPLALGRDISVEDMRSIESLAAFLAQTDYSYMGTQTVSELVDLFYPYFCDKIVDGKQLDQERLGHYLDCLKTIADNCGIIATRPENEQSYGMWDLAAKAKFALTQADGFTSCMFPMSMTDYIKGDFTAFENSFIPSAQVGICAKTEKLDAAEDFLRFLLSEQVQDKDGSRGFPVNARSLQNHAEKDRSDLRASTMIMAEDGSYLEFDSKSYPRETAMRLTSICESLNTPIREDAKIREVLIECLGGYLDGSQSLEQTIQKMEDGLKMYLAE